MNPLTKTNICLVFERMGKELPIRYAKLYLNLIKQTSKQD
jgi:hypothetical protein